MAEQLRETEDLTKAIQQLAIATAEQLGLDLAKMTPEEAVKFSAAVAMGVYSQTSVSQEQ